MPKSQKARKIYKKTTLYIARTGSDSEYKRSDPCKECYKLIKEHEIDKIVFSGDNGEVSVCKVKDYTTNHVTHGNRYICNRT